MKDLASLALHSFLISHFVLLQKKQTSGASLAAKDLDKNHKFLNHEK